MRKAALHPNAKTKGFTLGRRAFGKISAVEGIHLSAAMEQDLRDFDRADLSSAQRRAAIARKYGRDRA